MDIESLWYKNAIIYAIDIHRFKDANGDGIGDFSGLIDRLDYLSDLGVTCIWLLPFYPTPYRDNGYDINDYFGVDPRVGSLDDFIAFLREAGKRSIRVMLDLVLDHTSDTHPWFIAARHNPDSRFRDYYSWTKYPPPVPPDKGPIFPGQEDTVWSYDETSQSYYYHRFYHFQPSLNTSNPEVQEEIKRILDFWLSFRVSGFRIDAVSHLVEGHGLKSTEPSNPHGILKDIHAFVDRFQPDVALLGEADVEPQELASFFGDNDELHLLFNFVLNNYLFLSLAREEATPIHKGLTQLPNRSVLGQWANFLRNLDELDLERLTDDERQAVFERFAPEETMKIFGRGIRRRLAPMLEGNRRRMEMAFSLLFSLPGTPVFVYGDEIGMGEDLTQEGRDAVRAPMQWSDEKNAGFSSAAKSRLVQPVIDEGPFGYKDVNVAAQQEDPDSFLNWVKKLVQVRRKCPEFGHGAWRLMEVDSSVVLVHRCVWKNGIVIAVHNFSGEEQRVVLDLNDQRGRQLSDLVGGDVSTERLAEGSYEIMLGPYGYRWYRIEGERVTE